jgi:hypothetical protein
MSEFSRYMHDLVQSRPSIQHPPSQALPPVAVLPVVPHADAKLSDPLRQALPSGTSAVGGNSGGVPAAAGASAVAGTGGAGSLPVAPLQPHVALGPQHSQPAGPAPMPSGWGSESKNPFDDWRNSASPVGPPAGVSIGPAAMNGGGSFAPAVPKPRGGLTPGTQYPSYSSAMTKPAAPVSRTPSSREPSKPNYADTGDYMRLIKQRAQLK